MHSPNILIVGAGALGIVTGYHLSLAGAKISFLVRPGRLEALTEPQILYCHDDASLKTFRSYTSIASVDEAIETTYDFILITLDGATCRGAEATGLLQSLGSATEGSEAIVLVAGLDVRDYCRSVMNYPDERLIEGTMGLLSYQTDRLTLPLHSSTDTNLLAQASMAYGYMGEGPGFMISGHPKPAALAFSRLYDLNGLCKSAIINPVLYRMQTRAIFPVFAAFDLAGWPNADGLAEHRDLMALLSSAVKEVLALPQHGWRGKLASCLAGPTLLSKLNRTLEKRSLPIDYSAFSAFHHGDKVRNQDIGIMKSCSDIGREAGMPMSALCQLITRYEAHIEGKESPLSSA